LSEFNNYEAQLTVKVVMQAILENCKLSHCERHISLGCFGFCETSPDTLTTMEDPG
jgi:hypothetical protein